MRFAPLAALLLLVASLSLRPMAESDLFFRIKAGQEILAHRALPDRNLFSFTHPDYPDLDTSWLFEVGAAALHKRGGFPAIVVAKTIVLLLAFAAAYVLGRRRGAGRVASVLALAAAAFVARDRFVERPHLFSLLGVVGVLLGLDAVATRTGRSAVRATLALLAGIMLWANFHAGVFMAPILLACGAAGTAIERNRPATRRLAIAAAGAALATLATPVGFGLYRYLRLHLVIPALHPVDEFRAPTFTSDPALLIFIPVLVLVLVLVLVPDRRRPDWRALLPAVPLLLLTLHSVRFAADFALASAPVLAVALTALAARLAQRWPRFVVEPVPAVAVAALLAGLAVGSRVVGSTAAGIGLDERELPLPAIAFVNRHGLRERMYNDFEIGSYLLFDPIGGYPHHRVFVDPRLPAYPLDLHRLLGRSDLTRADWSEAMDRYGVQSALLSYAGVNRRVSWWDPERYALVYREGDARVFVRRLPQYRALVADREIPATFSFSAEEGTVTVPIETRPAASPVGECEWQRRLGDLLFELDGKASPRALAAYARALGGPAGCLRAADEAHLAGWLGALALGSGRAVEALEYFDRALARGDRELSTLTNRAVALEGLGRKADAAAAWQTVITRAGDSPLASRARQRREALY